MSKNAADLNAFATPPQGGRYTSFGCPDCSGVLAVSELGSNGYLRFTCQVGHVYSAETLLESKEVEFEESLWAATETAKELGLLRNHLAARVQTINGDAAAKLYASADQVQQDGIKLRAILEGRGVKVVHSDK